MAFDYRLRFAGASATAEASPPCPVDDLAVAAYDRGDGSRLVLDVEANTARYRADEVDAHLDRLVRVLDALCDPAGQDRPLRVARPADPRRAGAGPRRGRVRPGRTGAQRCPPGSRHRSSARPTPWPSSTATGRSPTPWPSTSGPTGWRTCWRPGGVGRGDVVAWSCPARPRRSWPCSPCSKAGAAHLAIDPDHPAPRVAAMLADARPGAASWRPPAWRRWSGRSTLVLDDPRVADEIAAAAAGRLGPDHAPTLDDAAYVIYTLGFDRAAQGRGGPARGHHQPRPHRGRGLRRRAGQPAAAVRVVRLRRDRVRAGHGAAHGRRPRRSPRASCGWPGPSCSTTCGATTSPRSPSRRRSSPPSATSTCRPVARC